MQLSSKQRTNYASMSGNIVNFNAAANTANTNDGTPQVSILASASAKRMQEKRRQLRQKRQPHLGKQYPGVGTHHRNTKHVWLFSELAEVSAAYKEHHTTMPCWKIADMLYYSFGEQLKHNQQQHQQQQAIDNDDDQPIAQLREPRTHLPSIQAIQAKLLDCITLQYKDTLGYASQPTQMHKQVWEHLELAKKHHTMLKEMAAVPVSVPVQIKEEQEQEQDMKLNPLAPIWNVHPTSFYTPDAEFEAAEPPTKRRKVVFEDEEVQEQPQIKQEHPASKADFDAGIAELVSLMGEADDARRQEHALIQRLVNKIREHNDQIGSLVSNIKDSHAEIEQHRQAIACKMQQIESIITPVPLPTPATATATAAAAAPATPPAMVCNKCTRTIEGGLGGFSVHYADPSHPDNGTIECDECAPLSPASRKFVEQREAELEAEFSEMGRAVGSQPQHRFGYSSDSDDDMYMNDGYYPGFGGAYYDHAEECS